MAITSAAQEQFIFGSRDSSNRAVRLRKKGERFYSESNFNLLLDRDVSRFTLGQFFNALRLGTIWEMIEAEGDHEPIKLLEDTFSRACSGCQRQTRLACALFQRPGFNPPKDATIKDVISSSRWPAKDAPHLLTICGLVNSLLGMTETAAERRFLELYILDATRWSLPVIDALEEAYNGRTIPDWATWEIGDSQWMWDLHWTLLHSLHVPALIPQVVLNLVIPRDLPDGHPDKNFYDHNVGRVDFVYLDGGTKHIVEIDGPYHHTGEADYTRLLRRDRSLRRAGYAVHRFSNSEVMAASNFHDFRLFY